MNLNTIPDEVWSKLASYAILAAGNRLDVNYSVGNYFYSQIYETWGKGKVDYKTNDDTIIDAGWQEMVKEWTSIRDSGQFLCTELKDDSVGRAGLQVDQDGVRMARLWEVYNNGHGDRFQFVVEAGGGMVLFNRMRRACQTYIIERLSRDTGKSVVMGWKVFGEEGATGRSDSCVVYLACSWADPRLAEVINTYIWPNIKDLVDVNFTPLGFYPIDNKPLWAMPLPNEATERAVLGVICQGSAGGLMANVFGKAFKQAAPTATANVDTLVATAKQKAEELVKALYP